MEIDCFEIEDIITLSAGGGYGGEISHGVLNRTGETRASTEIRSRRNNGRAEFDSDIMGGNEFQEMLENLYQNFIKFI